MTPLAGNAYCQKASLFTSMKRILNIQNSDNHYAAMVWGKVAIIKGHGQNPCISPSQNSESTLV